MKYRIENKIRETTIDADLAVAELISLRWSMNSVMYFSSQARLPIMAAFAADTKDACDAPSSVLVVSSQFMYFSNCSALVNLPATVLSIP